MKQLIFQIWSGRSNAGGCKFEMFEWPVRISYDGEHFTTAGFTLFKCDRKAAIEIMRLIQAADHLRFNVWVDEKNTLLKWGSSL